MFRSTLRHKVALLLLGACLIASMASAGDLRGRQARSTSSDSFQAAALLSWLAEHLSALWMKNGAEFDPFGLHATPPPPPGNSLGEKNGGGFDPFGLHGTPPMPASATSTAPNSVENGCGLDPFGCPAIP